MNATPRIVLIDDNRAWLETLAEYLRDKGYAVLTAGDAAQGLHCLAKNKVSLVVCDYHLPGMNGLEFVRYLRKQQKDVAVLMISSDEEPTLAARALAEGARAFLPKDTSPGVLLRKVRQLADAAAAPGPAPQALHPWQRLLPGPQHFNRGRGKDRAAARSSRPGSDKPHKKLY
jgi:CheY-like chemotaxis protein